VVSKIRQDRRDRQAELTPGEIAATKREEDIKKAKEEAQAQEDASNEPNTG